MNNKILKYQIFSIIFTFLLGVLLHFTYNLSNSNPVVAVFSAVNESTWEHLKLLFFPMLITTILGYFYFGKKNFSFICSKTIGIVSALIFTVVFFYTYTGIIGNNIPIIDISTFFIATILGEYIAYRLMITNFTCNEKIAKAVLVILTICFIVFTFLTPKIRLFKDPVTNKYGIESSKSYI